MSLIYSLPYTVHSICSCALNDCWNGAQRNHLYCCHNCLSDCFSLTSSKNIMFHILQFCELCIFTYRWMTSECASVYWLMDVHADVIDPWGKAQKRMASVVGRIQSYTGRPRWIDNLQTQSNQNNNPQHQNHIVVIMISISLSAFTIRFIILSS